MSWRFEARFRTFVQTRIDYDDDDDEERFEGALLPGRLSTIKMALLMELEVWRCAKLATS